MYLVKVTNYIVMIFIFIQRTRKVKKQSYENLSSVDDNDIVDLNDSNGDSEEI